MPRRLKRARRHNPSHCEDGWGQRIKCKSSVCIIFGFSSLMMCGFYVVISRGNLVKKLVGLNIFQTSVFILYISMGKIAGGTAPILTGMATIYSNPVPHVLILTAIVVGIATTALVWRWWCASTRLTAPSRKTRSTPKAKTRPCDRTSARTQVVVPLIAAPLCALLHPGRAVWLLAMAACALCLLIAALLLDRVLAEG